MVDMDIVKILKDYVKSPQEELFEEFLNEHLNSAMCSEEIKNPNFILQVNQPVNDFLIYTNSSPLVEARRLYYKK